jgi:hypothetical protein
VILRFAAFRCAVAHPCHDPQRLGPNRETNIVRLLYRLLISFRSAIAEEGHVQGFPRNAFAEFLGLEKSDAATPLPLARGGLLGGSRQYLEVAAAVFDVVAHATLTAGHMGTDENVLRCVRTSPQG